MSVKEPIITELKKYTSKFLENYGMNVPITDANTNLLPFCKCMENILLRGLIPQYNPIRIPKEVHAWTWIDKQKLTPRLNLNIPDVILHNYVTSLDYVRSCKCIFTSTGRLRLLIRICLVKKCLHVPIVALMKSSSYRALYCPNRGILGDEILSQIFLSVLLQYAKFTFRLDLLNNSFLDLSWILPEIQSLEFGPNQSLGISIIFNNNKAIVIKVDSNSRAEEKSIEPGDVLDELNGTHLCLATRKKLDKIRKNQHMPVFLKVIKLHYNEKGELYPPLLPIIRCIPLVAKNVTQSPSPSEKSPSNSINNENISSSNGIPALYVGNIPAGTKGDAREINKCLKQFHKMYHHKDRLDDGIMRFEKIKTYVKFEIGEIGMKIVNSQSGEVVLDNTYMEISSCGSASFLKHYFAYIVGDQSSSLNPKFTCYIFYTKYEDHMFTILQSIGQGFQRTHYAV